jgi:FtsZ-binding cell division protein ZapB
MDALNDAILAVVQERDRLRAENNQLRDQVRTCVQALNDEERENEALKADAERYRFLCRLNETDPDAFYDFPDACGWTKEEMDKFVDALRGEGD